MARFNLEEQFTPKELTAAITVELIARKIKEIERKHTTLGNYVVGGTVAKKQNRISGKNIIIWILIVEAFKILKYEEPPTKCRNIFEQSFKLSYLTLYILYPLVSKKLLLLKISLIISHVYIN